MCLKNRARSYLNRISGHRYTPDMARRVTGCNHLRPAEGTETSRYKSAWRLSSVATTYDPLRVLKQHSAQGAACA